MTAVTLTLPDDWHIHLRDGEALTTTVPDVARWAGRAIVMPNLMPPVLSVSDALSYRGRILAHVPEGGAFDPLMVLYLTDATTPEMVAEAADSPHVQGIKLYPAGATTNSDAGVTGIESLFPVFEAMERHDLPLLIHGEVTDHHVDIFDREKAFIDSALIPIVDAFPALRIVFEHITTEQAVDFVGSADRNLAATITPHHLHINRNAMFAGGLRSDFYCLPVAKRECHRQALRRAATSGDPRFFLGTDTAPHERASKESACGCAGIFNAPFALESYAQVFDEEGALEHLEAFTSLNGPAFYNRPANTRRITLQRRDHLVPELVNGLVPFHAGEILSWAVADAPDQVQL